MREFLMELYITYGVREFNYADITRKGVIRYEALMEEYLHDGPGLITNITPKALEYIKKNDS